MFGHIVLGPVETETLRWAAPLLMHALTHFSNQH